MAEKKRALGRGLSALIGDAPVELDAPNKVTSKLAENQSAEMGSVQPQAAPQNNSGFMMLGIDQLQAGAFQPRQNFAEEDLENLSKSLKEKGVLQPLLVRSLPDGAADGQARYEIVAGERRWRAAQRARLHQVPVLVRELSDTEALEIAIIENVQRADLNPIEESLAYQRLMQEFSYTQEELAKTLGKSRSHIANMLRLTGVSDKVRKLLIAGDLSAGHARALLNFDGADALAKRIVAEGLSVRAVEKIVAEAKGGHEKPKTKPKKPTKNEKDVDTLALEQTVQTALGLGVDIQHQGAAGGTLSISYKTLEQLDDVVGRLMQRKI